MNGGKLVAPWSEEQVDAINDWQECDYVHPFTCPCDHPETEDQSSLVATEAGLYCPEPSCEYEQSWVHAYMADPVIVGEIKLNGIFSIDRTS